ncbi:MAG: GGDEF domain-containing protein [Actinomycetota bacterium]|jgi:diguanylate cyclase (GGDEF)-like protein|nr:GGDEF domain-containing protein [Actinomycetota bacterium]
MPMFMLMRFSVDRPDAEIARGALVSGLVACSLLVPIVVTYFLDVSWRQEPAYWIGAIAIMAVPVGYIIWRLRTSAGDPRVAFVVVCCAVVAIGLVQAGSHSSIGIYRPVLLVPVAYVVLIGDRRMVAATGMLVVAVLTWSSWVDGIRGRLLVSEVAVFAVVAAVIVWMTNRSVTVLHRYVATRTALQHLDEAIADAESVEDAVRRGLPLVSSVVGGARSDVWAYPSVEEAPELLASDPPDRDHVTAAPDPAIVRSCIERNRPVVRPELSLVPVGYSQAGILVLAVHHPRHDRERLVQLRAIGNELAAVFLRTTSRAAFVAGLRIDARTDALTGLPNRRGLVERLDAEIARAVRDRTPLSVGMADLDHFKRYNDAHGHVAGDALLRAVAGRLVASLRRTDTVARYGGEEFCVLLPGTDLSEATRVLDDARRSVKEQLLAEGVTISAGVATVHPDDALGTTCADDGPFDPIERADRALYRAKNGGRDRVMAEPGPASSATSAALRASTGSPKALWVHGRPGSTGAVGVASAATDLAGESTLAAPRSGPGPGGAAAGKG